MNDLSNINTMGVTRTADVVALELRSIVNQYKSITLSYAVEFGRLLFEARELVEYGEWEKWLKANTEFSKSTAENLINLFEAYGADQIGFFGQLKAQTFGGLTVTKALALLKVPEDEREDFVEDNDVENLSTRQLQKLIKEKQEAEDQKAKAVRDMEEAQGREKKAQDAQAAAEKAAKKASDDLAAEKKKAANAAAVAKDLKSQLAALKAKPAEIPNDDAENANDGAESANDVDMEAIRQEAKEAAERELQAKIEAAEKQAREAEARAAELQKKLAVADPAVSKFAALYEEVQGLLAKLVGQIGEAAPEKQAGLRKALAAALDQYIEQLRS